MVLAATPNQASWRQRQACSTATIDNDSMALMLCPSALSAPTLINDTYHWYICLIVAVAVVVVADYFIMVERFFDA